MDYITDIYDKAASLMRGNTSVNAELLEEMCRNADIEFSGRLREGMSREDIEELYVRACAMLAVALYMQFDESGDLTSVRVGSVSLSRKGAGGHERVVTTLRRQAELMLASCLNDGGFWFQSVKG